MVSVHRTWRCKHRYKLKTGISTRPQTDMAHNVSTALRLAPDANHQDSFWKQPKINLAILCGTTSVTSGCEWFKRASSRRGGLDPQTDCSCSVLFWRTVGSRWAADGQQVGCRWAAASGVLLLLLGVALRRQTRRHGLQVPNPVGQIPRQEATRRPN